MLWALLDDVQAGLSELFSQTLYEQPARDAGAEPGVPVLRQPVVYIGDLPETEEPAGSVPECPYILLRLPEGETSEADDGRKHAALLRILCGVWSADGKAAQQQTILQMQYRVLQWLCQNRFVARRWERMFPLKWGLGTSGDKYADGGQAQPYSVAWTEARFAARAETETVRN